MRKISFGTALIAGTAVLLAILAIAITVGMYSRTSYVVFTVTGKESVAVNTDNSSSGHEYRVYTNKGTFVVKDSLLHPRFNSSDVYGSLREDKTYRCKVYGFRIPIVSSFKNILSCTSTLR